MTRCTATTLKGTQCKNSAVTDTNPPRCSIPSHQTDPNAPTRKQAGAPLDNKNAEKHGAYSRATPTTDPDATFTVADIANAIADLQQKRERLSKAIDAEQDIPPLEHAKLLDFLGRLDSRIARLYKQLRELTGEGPDKHEADIDQALKVLSKIFETDLTGP